MNKITNKLPVLFILIALMSYSCSSEEASKSAKDILGNPEYQAICYGGYRDTVRTVQPSIQEIKDDN